MRTNRRKMSRERLGNLMMHWHGGQNDPVYAVASFYVVSRVYPKRGVVKDALWNLEKDLREFQTMQRGEPVMVRRYGKQVDLRKFAGFTSRMIDRNVRQLTNITRALKHTIRADYPPSYRRGNKLRVVGQRKKIRRT